MGRMKELESVLKVVLPKLKDRNDPVVAPPKKTKLVTAHEKQEREVLQSTMKSLDFDDEACNIIRN
jgi:hypothetical protein